MTQHGNSRGKKSARHENKKKQVEARTLLAVVSLLGVSLGVGEAAPVEGTAQPDKVSTSLDGLSRVAESNQAKTTAPVINKEEFDHPRKQPKLTPPSNNVKKLDPPASNKLKW